MADGDFEFRCPCGRPLLKVVGAESQGIYWNYQQAWGGHPMTCPPCGRTFLLGGRVDAYGDPDLIEDKELSSVDHLTLTPLQLRTLDISLVAEQTLWEKQMDLVKEADRAGDADKARGLWFAAKQIRGAFQMQKAETLKAIFAEHGIKGLPARLRIARGFNGAAAIYAVDRGPVKQKVEVEEPHRFARLDLS